MATKWTTVRLSKNLHERLVRHQEKTNLPIAVMIRLAVEQYLKPDNGSRLFLELLKENLEFADEVREVILQGIIKND